MQYELLLLNVIRNSSEHSGAFREYLGGHIIASYISRFDFRAKVYSCDVLNVKTLLENEITNHKVNIIGFYIGADTRIMTGHVMRWLKENYPDVKILAGGPEAYSLDEKFMIESGCDYAVYGEGEVPVLNILRYEIDSLGERESIRGIKYINESGKYTVNPPEALIHDLDNIPFPDKHNSLDKNFRSGDSIGILTGRGCPYHCAFCFEGAASKTLRFRSIENIIAEIESLREYNPSLRYVNIYDDTFTLNLERVKKFCAYMKGSGLNWTCEGHVLNLYRNPEMIHMMSDSGLHAIQIGIESGSQKVLEAYNKKITPEMIIDVVRMCKSAGLLRVEGNYIIGGAFESTDTINESIEHAKKLIEIGRGIIEINTVFFAPYFGTPVTKSPEHYGIRINHDRMNHMIVTMRDAVCDTESLSVNDIVRLKERFDRELRHAYMTEASHSRKEEVLRGSGFKTSGRIKNHQWLNAWKNYPHILEFMRHMNPSEQECNSHSYPVRTCTDYDSELLMLADGRRQIHEISEYTCRSEEEIMSAYRELNNQCLVYFSEF